MTYWIELLITIQAATILLGIISLSLTGLLIVKIKTYKLLERRKR